MKKQLLTCALLLATGFANAQYFQYLYGTVNPELLPGDGHNAYQGGTLGHFMASPTPGANTNLVAERTDRLGSTGLYFNNVYSFFNPMTATVVNVNEAKSIEFLNGTGFGVVGSFTDPSTGVNSIYYTHLQPTTGAIIVSLQYFPVASYAYNTLRVTSVAPSKQNFNEFYVCGEIIDATGLNRVYALKLRQNGTIVWSWVYDLNTSSTTHVEWPNSILESTNPIGGVFEVMIAGAYADASPTDGFILRVDHTSGLITVNPQTYGTAAQNEYFNAIENSANPSVTATQDGYVLCGMSDGGGSADVWNVAIDQPGNVIWSNVFDYNNGGPTFNQDEGVDLVERLLVASTSTYEYYIVSTTDNGFFGMEDVVVTKLDGNGNAVLAGQFTYGDSQNDHALRIDMFSCNEHSGISMYGISDHPSLSIGGGGNDHYLVTAHFNGVTACNYNLQNLIQNTGPGALTNYTGNTLAQFNMTQLVGSNPSNAREIPICTPSPLYFQSTYGTTGNDYISDGHNVYTNGLGHLLAGTTDAVATTFFDLEVQRTDQLGSTGTGFNNIYTFAVAGNPLSIGASRSAEFSNGTGFGIAGSYKNTVVANVGIYYLNVNAAGGITSARRYVVAGPTAPYAYNVVAIKESVQNPNLLYICGTLFFGNLQRVFILKITQAGAIVWSQVYDLDTSSPDNNTDIAADLVESAYMNGGTYELLVVGEHQNGGVLDAFVLRTDYNTGAVIGTVQLYGGATSYDKFTSIKNAANPNITPTNDGYIIGGYTNDKVSGDMDFWLTAIDLVGNVTWSNMFDYNNGGTSFNEDLCNDVIERLNNCGDYEYYMAGRTNAGLMGGADAVVIKADGNGNGVANGQFTYGTSSQEQALRVDQLNGTTTDGIAVYGGTYLNTILNEEHYLVKAYFNGVTACQYDLRNPIQAGGPGIQSTPTPGIIAFFNSLPVAVSIPSTAADNMICSAVSIASGDNRRVAATGGKTTEPAEAGLTNLVLYPNPASANGTVFDLKLVSDLNQQGTVTIIDVLGREYFTGSFQLSKGANNLHLLPQGTNMAKGTYFVSIRTATDSKKIILLVQ